MSRKTPVEWLTLIATFSLLCVAVYAFLYERTVQKTLLSGVAGVSGRVMGSRTHLNFGSRQIELSGTFTHWIEHSEEAASGSYSVQDSRAKLPLPSTVQIWPYGQRMKLPSGHR